MNRNSFREVLVDDNRKSHLRPHSLFEDIVSGSYRTTEWGEFLDFDEAIAEMLGYSDRESLMAIQVDKLYVNPQDRHRWQYLMARKGVLFHFEVQLRRRDRSAIWVSDSARIIRDEDGQVLYYEGVLEDINDQKRSEDERNV